MIRLCTSHDFNEICAIINDGAEAYEGIIPADRWSQPYMPPDKLRHEIDDGVIFWGYEENGALAGVMGIQEVHPQGSPAVTLIRHAYVRTSSQGQGIGAHLLAHLRTLATGPVLIGTWADAVWAIGFYQKHGFQIVNPADKDRLLKTYWSVPDRQIETSVVLADQHWRERTQAA